MSLADLYSALADPTRLRVLELLHDKPRPVHDLAAAFDISRPAISRHLRVLKEAGLVREVKQGRENVYSFQPAILQSGMDWLQQHQGDTAAPPAKAKAEPVRARVAKPRPVVPVPEPTAPRPAAIRRAAKPPVAPPAAAPQLSFFDL